MADGPWKLPAGDLYMHHDGELPSEARPLCPGDVFEDIPLPGITGDTPEVGELDLIPQRVMLLPHPCQNYHGDVLRQFLVVAPVREVPPNKAFRSKGGDWGKFPLLGLVDGTDMYCDLARACSIPSSWLGTGKRSACLSLEGIALLSRRLMVCFTRWKPTHENVRAELVPQWLDLIVWTAWFEGHGQHEGYEDWKRGEVQIQGPQGPELVLPRDVIVSRT